jgi:hypothetical protein
LSRTTSPLEALTFGHLATMALCSNLIHHATLAKTLNVGLGIPNEAALISQLVKSGLIKRYYVLTDDGKRLLDSVTDKRVKHLVTLSKLSNASDISTLRGL